MSSNETYWPVSPYTGKTFRLEVADCEGRYLTATDVDAIRYTVYRIELGERVPVEGHTEVEIATSALLDTPVVSADTGNTYNFECRISAATIPPFAAYNEYYLVVFTFFVEGEPYGCVIPCFST